MKNILNKTKGFTLVELMVVIVIVGILAAVAIPKFLDASQKAKASEFPTQLTAIYTGQLAYNAEKGQYVTQFAFLRDSAGVDVPSSSRWFIYTMTNATATTFTGTATVNTAFGSCTGSDYGTIDQTNSKYATAALARYAPSWR
ncbi:MAG TPA: prepilin-type N-terminal cleavage/methylation domain-containing protein [Chitinivibrionales bacterium]|nr:prepilin-type N-terminal cleavage/methylation domain-containing protein [Chitinivibrionales bacterium]